MDIDGEKVGTVAVALQADEQTGAPLRLVVKQGFLFHHEREIPIRWWFPTCRTTPCPNDTKDDLKKLAG